MSRFSFAAKTVTQGVWKLFIVAVAIFGIFLGVIYRDLTEVKEMAQEVERTEAIERELQRLEEDLLSAETGQRGYLLTQNETYLEPYLDSIKAVGERFVRLDELMHLPEARKNLALMQPLAAAKLDDMANTIALARQGQRQAALALIQTGKGNRLMNDFRKISHETIELELRLLDERRAKLMSELQDVFYVSIFGSGVAVLVLFFTASATARRLKNPITALLGGIKAMSEGKSDFRVQVTSQDEIGKLTDAFNAMAERVDLAQQARNAALAELERSNAELDGFAYVASHDLKAPLRGIRNLAEWIAEDVEKTASPDTKENLNLLRNRVDRLDNLLESLLTYSRVGRKVGSAERVDCGRLVNEIKDYLAPGSNFDIAIEGKMPILFTPKAPLEQVLRNLISNAIKHHDRESGLITVSAQDEGSGVEFRVTDDGPGIPPQFHERIFQMFQTLKSRDQIEGSGMGLAIVKKTVEGFGGQVRVESNPPQRGSTIAFSWPKQTATSMQPA